jgi:ABC-type dipeptide/oligopeptide/nickel transport system ATPase component
VGTEMEKFKRWLDVFLVIVFAAAIIWLVFEPLILPLSEWLSRQHAANRLIYIFLVSSFLWFFIKTTGGAKINGIIRYPSSWFISILLFLLFCAAELFFIERINTNILFLNFSAVFLGVMITSVGCCVFEQKNSCKYKHISKGSSVLSDPKEIIKWSLSESPIYEISEDLFNHKYAAEKVKGILKSSPNKNVGIIGSFGSGKSSIINLIMSQRGKEDIYCKIEGWGFKEDTAVEHILQLIIEELKNHFDCLSIYNVPKQYHDAMTNSGNYIFSFLSVFMQETRNPEKILRKIDNALQCLNKKLFIILEDIDRNVNNDATFYNEIASFLNVTKKLNQISFIVALSPREQLNPVLMKLCEYNEYIQRIDKNEIIKVFDSLIIYFNEKFSYDRNIKSIKDIRSSLGIPKNRSEADIFQALDRMLPMDYVAQLLDTPRKLKGTIRGIYTAWNKLHGEVEFVTLLLATILRTAAPEAYSFVNENIQHLRKLGKSYSSDKKLQEEKIKQLNKKWENATIEVSWDSEAARHIVYILFPAFISQESDLNRYSRGDDILQGVTSNNVTDYWKKINVESLLPEEISDQTIFKAIEDWQKKHSNKGFVHNGQNMTLAEAIFQVEGVSDKIEIFGEPFKSKEICELASELFELALKKYGHKANEDICPGFINLWRLYHKKGHVETEYDTWLINEIKKALNMSLHFSIDLYYYWRHATTYSVNSKEPTPELRKKVVESIRERFDGRPEDLTRIMDQEDPWGLRHIYGMKENEVEIWGWLGKVLLDAAKINLKLISSYVACLISKSELKHSTKLDRSVFYDNKIDYDVIKEIFGNNVKAVMELLSNEFEYPELADDFYHAQTRSVIQSAREEAKAWLKTH